MAFDIMNLFEETENVITELDEGNELAAVDFANRISSMSPSCSATKSYAVYQDDAVIRYAQWFIACNKELGIDRCIDGLHQYASRFWYADTPILTEEGVATAVQMVDALFSYSQKVLDKHPVDILLIDAQHECLNGETFAMFTAGGMQSCICIYHAWRCALYGRVCKKSLEIKMSKWLKKTSGQRMYICTGAFS